MTSEIIWIIVAWVSLPMLVILAGFLVWRRVVYQFPAFFSYVCVSVLVELVRLIAHQGAKRTYFYAYWISEIALTIFALLATYELFVKRLFPRFYTVRFYRRLVPIAAILSAAVAALTLVGSTKTVFVFIKVIHGFDFVRVALMFLFVLLMLFMGREWSRYEFGIAFGLAVDAATFLMAFATVWTKLLLAGRVLEELPAMAYDVACIIWLVTLAKPERTRHTKDPITGEMIHDARKWEETLKNSFLKKPPESSQ